MRREIMGSIWESGGGGAHRQGPLRAVSVVSEMSTKGKAVMGQAGNGRKVPILLQKSVAVSREA